MIYYIFGKSASGKDTIYKRLKACHPDWKKVTPYTTRPIREGEQEGVEYHFVTDAQMDQFERAGRIIEERRYQTVYGPWRYATVNDGQITMGDHEHYLMIGVLESYVSTRDYFGAEHVFPIYIEVPDEIRLARAEARERKEANPRLQEMRRRFDADNVDFSEANLAAAGIRKRYQNLDLEACIAEINDETSKNTGKSNL